MTELTNEQWIHLVDLLLAELEDENFRVGVAIGLANRFTLEEYERYLREKAE